MGLLELILGANNPAAQWANQNNNLLGAMGAGIASGPDFSTGLAQGLQYAPQARTADREAQEKVKADAKLLEQTNQTVEFLRANYPDIAQAVESGAFTPAQGYSEAFSRQSGGGANPTQDIQEYEYARENGFTGSFAEWMQTGRNGSAGPQLGMTPQWARDPQTGQYVLGQMSSDGRFQPTEMGGLQPVDPFSMTGGKVGATVDAKTSGAARAALPAAQVQVETTLDAVDRLTTDEAGMNEWFGQAGALPRGMYIQGGSPMGNWVANFSQAEGQAFLQARQFLKEQGAITEVESAKAELAYSRMAAAKQTGDKQNFLQAAADFKAAVLAGYQKLEATAQGEYSQGSPAVTGAPPAATGGGWTVIGVE